MSSNLKVLQVIPKLGYGGAETARIASMWGLSLGRSAITTESTFTTLQPRSRTRPITCSSSTRLSAPFHLGSVGGKYLPISPSERAPSKASMIACTSTSASLWPSRPRPPGCSRVWPPRISGRPGTSRWMS